MGEQELASGKLPESPACVDGDTRESRVSVGTTRAEAGSHDRPGEMTLASGEVQDPRDAVGEDPPARLPLAPGATPLPSRGPRKILRIGCPVSFVIFLVVLCVFLGALSQITWWPPREVMTESERRWQFIAFILGRLILPVVLLAGSVLLEMVAASQLPTRAVRGLGGGHATASVGLLLLAAGGACFSFGLMTNVVGLVAASLILWPAGCFLLFVGAAWILVARMVNGPGQTTAWFLLREPKTRKDKQEQIAEKLRDFLIRVAHDAGERREGTRITFSGPNGERFSVDEFAHCKIGGPRNEIRSAVGVARQTGNWDLLEEF